MLRLHAPERRQCLDPVPVGGGRRLVVDERHRARVNVMVACAAAAGPPAGQRARHHRVDHQVAANVEQPQPKGRLAVRVERHLVRARMRDAAAVIAHVERAATPAAHATRAPDLVHGLRAPARAALAVHHARALVVLVACRHF